MTPETIALFIEQYPYWALVILVAASFIVYLIGRLIVGKALVYLTERTENKWDDVIVAHLHPFRVAWIAPLLLIYGFAYLAPQYQGIVEKIALFLVMWVVALTLNSLLNAINEIYESSPSYNGVPIQSYLDLIKLLILIVVLVLSVSLITGEPPTVLLTGIGAATAVLLLVFRDTILSVVASFQIAANDLIKEGDWIEVPSYDADGDVLNISLHTIKIQNWDMTLSIIPTYKILEVSYKNWRGMTESGGRRIKRSITLDQNSIQFCTPEMLEKYRVVDLLETYIEEKIAVIEKHHAEFGDRIDFPLDGPQVTNAEVFRYYIDQYLKSRPDIHQEGLTLLVRDLAPSERGLPIEVYAFTKTTAWAEYEGIQADIFNHLIAAANFFDLRLFQEPTGYDMASAFRRKQ
ncbi:MAG: mechanosensitive ion channel family protein [Anaerolineales bacterium]